MPTFTPEQIAAELQMTPYVIRRWLVAGKLPGFKIGNKWRIDAEVFAVWLKQHSN